MRWNRSHESRNVDDLRGAPEPSGHSGAGLAMLLPLAGRFGWKGILVVLLLVAASRFIECPGAEHPTRRVATEPPAQTSAAEEELVRFVGFVFDDAQASLARQVERAGGDYREARMVLYRRGVSSGCGTASSAVGPFYCPVDGKVYIDLSFYRELRGRFGAPGDFAQAYVIAHELGHHAQNLAGAIESRSNRQSVVVELQADCLAGTWAHDAQRRGLLEVGDIDEALRAAAAVGDDTIQRRTTGDIRPETWTHGSAEQRAEAFRRGFRGGDLAACGM